MVREAIQKKREFLKKIGFICFDPLPLPPNKDIKNKDILLNYFTPSLLPKIRTYEPDSLVWGGVLELLKSQIRQRKK